MSTTSGEKYAKQVRQDTRKRQDTKDRQDRGDRGDRRGRQESCHRTHRTDGTEGSFCNSHDVFLNTNLRQYGRTGPESEKMKALCDVQGKLRYLLSYDCFLIEMAVGGWRRVEN